MGWLGARAQGCGTVHISLWNVDGAQNELLLPPDPGRAKRDSARGEPCSGSGESRGQGRGKHPLVWETSLGLENIPLLGKHPLVWKTFLCSLPANTPGQSRLLIRLKISQHLTAFNNKTKSGERLFTRAGNDRTRGFKLKEVLD